MVLLVLMMLAILFGVMVWIAFAMIGALIASGKGRSLFGFLILGLFLPVIGLIAAMIVQPTKECLEARSMESGSLKKCPHCAELVKAEAIVCRYCGKALTMPKKLVTVPIG